MKTLELFEQMRSLSQQTNLSIRIEHENLETVYLEPTADQRVLIYDRAHAYSYLSANNDSTYRDWSELGIQHLR